MSCRLAIELSGATGSVALARGGEVVARRILTERGRHAAALPGAIADTLAAGGARAAEVTQVVVGAGPGSFTGVRVGGAAANGFAHALGIPVVAVSSLAGAALTSTVLPAGAGPGAPFRVLFDARGDRLFAAAYRVTPGAFEVIESPRFVHLPDLLDHPGLTLACGDGAARHEEALRAAGIEVMPPPAGVPTADGLLAAWARGVGGPPVPAGGWEPDYLRETGAVRARRGEGP